MDVLIGLINPVRAATNRTEWRKAGGHLGSCVGTEDERKEANQNRAKPAQFRVSGFKFQEVATTQSFHNVFLALTGLNAFCQILSANFRPECGMPFQCYSNCASSRPLSMLAWLALKSIIRLWFKYFCT